ncbi:MAG: hypothetical protein ACREOP_15520 [Thermodesulfobacteriota bacterium]
MNVLAQILLMILQALPWGELIKLALGLIRKQAPDVESGVKSGEQAEAENIAAMKTATSMSPGISAGPLKFIHDIAYMLHVQLDKPDKFARWNEELQKWKNLEGSVAYDDPTVSTVYDRKFGYMDLYTSHPDSKR